ncbi:hypothetical protein G6L37_06785 [Agrobacterium rubi]|nr:hypothetical protein [Agrobacterium rubi]NTF25070.1 hypothetical protein [Agrobacterium rubi]
MTMDSRDDIGIRFGAQDVEWLLSSIDLMLATGMATGSSDQTRERMKKHRDQLALQSALPRHKSSYEDSFRYNDALEAVRGCDAWEARLTVDENSYFKDCMISIETHTEGKRERFKLTSDLQLGRDSEFTPRDKYGVYLSRLVDICQNVAPETSVQLDEQVVRVVADWRNFMGQDKKSARQSMEAVLTQGGGLEDLKGLFIVRRAALAGWKASGSEHLPDHLRFIDVAISTSAEGHERLSSFAADYNETMKTSAQIIPLRAG